MKQATLLCSLTMLLLIAGSNKSFSQNCSKENAQKIENGFPNLKYCLENIGWRESVKKYEWRVTVYNLYEDMRVDMAFNLIEAGAPRIGLGTYRIPPNGYKTYSFYFSSEPEFIYQNIKLTKD